MKTVRQKFRHQGRGTILLIASLFLASAGARLANSANEALPITNNMSEPATLPQSAPVEAGPPLTATSRSGMADLLDELRQREAAVEARELELITREKTLVVAREEIERRLALLEETEKRLSATLSRADTAADEDVAQLTNVYENMKPKNAAALFEEMDPEFAAGFLGHMRADVAAEIMAGLTPQTAYTISVILAGRNANAPKS